MMMNFINNFNQMKEKYMLLMSGLFLLNLALYLWKEKKNAYLFGVGVSLIVILYIIALI